MFKILEEEKTYIIKITGELHDQIAVAEQDEQNKIAGLIVMSQLELETNEVISKVFVLDFDEDDDDNDYIIVEVQTYFILS